MRDFVEIRNTAGKTVFSIENLISEEPCPGTDENACFVKTIGLAGRWPSTPLPTLIDSWQHHDKDTRATTYFLMLLAPGEARSTLIKRTLSPRRDGGGGYEYKWVIVVGDNAEERLADKSAEQLDWHSTTASNLGRDTARRLGRSQGEEPTFPRWPTLLEGVSLRLHRKDPYHSWRLMNFMHPGTLDHKYQVNMASKYLGPVLARQLKLPIEEIQESAERAFVTLTKGTPRGVAYEVIDTWVVAQEARYGKRHRVTQIRDDELRFIAPKLFKVA